MAEIHPSAIVSREASLADDVVIGPFTLVEGPVRIESGVRLHSHVVVTGHTTIGPGCEVFPFASIGHPPQDMKYSGEPSELRIGANNRIREHVTMNPGTRGGGMVTRTGEGCLFMVGAHVAHDCTIGNHVIMANNATLGGHVAVEDHVVLGGLSAIHQFVRIGMHAMIGGMSGVENDVIPYGMVLGDRARLHGLNLIGLRRRGFERNDIDTLRKAYNLLFGEAGTIQDRVREVEQAFGHTQSVQDLLRFVKSESSRALCLPNQKDVG